MSRNSSRSLWRWLDDRTGLSELIGPSLNHLVPREAKWWYVFGSATLCAFLVQVVTGVALAFSYIPSTSQAYDTLQFITNDAPLGHLLRGMHYFGASAMVLMVGLHMAQVFLFGSFKYPRELNWMTGVLLLGFTLVMGFTGQLLRWDQTATWSVVVAADQVARTPLIGNWLAHFVIGGKVLGGATLTRFFAIHVFIMPALLFMFIGLHLLLVLRHGISEPPVPGRVVNPATYRKEYEEGLHRSGVPFFPYAAWRDVVFGLLTIVGIVVLAAVFGPPKLGKPPDPSLVKAYPAPDWYLLWYFAILALLPHGTEAWFMIAFPAAAALVLFVLPLVFNHGERAPSRRPWAVGIVIFFAVAIGALWIEGARAPWSPRFDAKPLPASVVGTTKGPIAAGALLFHNKSCIDCHTIDGHGGERGPNLSYVGDRLSAAQIILRINNGGYNMPAYASTLTPEQLNDLTVFLESRHRPKATAPDPRSPSDTVP